MPFLRRLFQVVGAFRVYFEIQPGIFAGLCHKKIHNFPVVNHRIIRGNKQGLGGLEILYAPVYIRLFGGQYVGRIGNHHIPRPGRKAVFQNIAFDPLHIQPVVMCIPAGKFQNLRLKIHTRNFGPGKTFFQGQGQTTASGAHIQNPCRIIYFAANNPGQCFGFGTRDKHALVHLQMQAVKLRLTGHILPRLAGCQTPDNFIEPGNINRLTGPGKKIRPRNSRLPFQKNKKQPIGLGRRINALQSPDKIVALLF